MPHRRCRSHCERCERYVVYRHYDSDFEACEYCVADHTLECAGCGEKFWGSDLESVDVSWFDQPTAVLLCENGSGQLREEQESEQDLELGVSLPGQMEIELAAV